MPGKKKDKTCQSSKAGSRPRACKLNGLQRKFVEIFAPGGITATEAMRRAGYSAATAAAKSTAILANPLVAAELARIRAAIDERTVYTAETAFNEAGEAYDMARKAGKPGDMVKAVALRAQIRGLLIEKHEHKVEQVQINVALDEARARLSAVPIQYDELVHDVQFTDVSKTCDAIPSDNTSDTGTLAALPAPEDRS